MTSVTFNHAARDYNPGMKALRGQLLLITAAYVCVLAVSSALVVMRYMQYVLHANDVDASGGMWAFGDAMLGLFIACLFLVPTFWLAFVLRNSEALYTTYSKVVFGVGVSAPLCLGVMAIPAVGQSNNPLGWVCLYRLMCAPVVLVGMAISRALARFPRAKRMTSCAVAIELLTIAGMVGMLML